MLSLKEFINITKYIAIVGFALFSMSYFFFKSPDVHLSDTNSFRVSEGETIRSVAVRLKERNYIKSANAFVAVSKFAGNKVLRGVYFFQETGSVFSYVDQLERGHFNQPIVKVLIKERSAFLDVVDLLVESLPQLDRDKLLMEIGEYGGMLYPDLYYFTEHMNENQIVSSLRSEFEQRTSDLFDSYKGDLTRDEILKIASIVELEATDYEDRRGIAGVILNRLAINMPLQVDVAFLYINGKDSLNLTRKDLETSNPYNLHRNSGLPPTPISNITRESISATLNHIEHKYYFFLADLNTGITYFSETFNQHLVKKEKYINN